MNNLIKKAFTLIELLVVIAIIGILSGLIIVGMNGMTNSANIAKSQVFSNSLRNSLMMNIVGEWKFDNISGTVGSTLADGTPVNDSWSTNNGSTSGLPTLKDGKDCVSGKCLSFNGSNFVNCGNNVPIGLNSFTFAFWAKTSAGSGMQIVMDRRDPLITGLELQFQVPRNSGVNALFIVTNGGYSGGWIYQYVNPYANNSNTIDGKWHYFVGTCDRSQHKPPDVYLDGVLANGGGWGYCDQFTSNVSSGATYIAPGFNGSIDDVRIFNAAMPTSYIKEQYYAGLNSLLSSGQINAEEYSEKINLIAGK